MRSAQTKITGYSFSECLSVPSGFYYDLHKFAEILQENVFVEQFFEESVQIRVKSKENLDKRMKHSEKE